MLGSMYSAVSGLSAHQTKMNVIGNNIANVNTYGFKSSRVTFSDVFYQTMNGASAPTANGGGTNPTQLGYGAKVNSVDVINTRAGSATTDRALDVYINGDGYLPTKNSDGVIKYTRVGVLSFDVSGNLVDSNGNQVLGFRMDETTGNAQLNSDGTTTAQNLVAIKVNPADLDKYTGIAIGQNGEITAIQEGDPTFVPSADTGWMSTAPTVNVASLYNGPINMSVTRGFTASASYTGDDTNIKVSSNADISSTDAMGVVYTQPSTYTLNYEDSSGTARTASGTLNTTTTPSTLTFTGVYDGTGTTATVTIPVDTTAPADLATGYYLPTGTSTTIGDIGTVAAAGTYNVKATTIDKSGATVTLTDNYISGTDTTITLGDISIQLDTVEFEAALDDGFTNINVGSVGAGPGEPIKIANIAVAKFTNPNALSQDGEGYFIQTTNSGEAVATIPGSSGTGTFRAGALEMSNVDLSREFTEMIITQRGFQANTRMITTSDEMLSELVAMKR
ncbi:MAG TPA: flagellar hook-basal body complex protein [Anaerovoracaceae bacterium]|nr:flagellar hook-basal body complex protein [Anaerovoracaceae bacterium]